MWPGCTHATAGDLVWYAAVARRSVGDSSLLSRAPAVAGTRRPSACIVPSENFEKLAQAEQLANETHVKASQIALAWVLNQQATTIALVGPSCVEQLAISLAAEVIELNTAESAWLELRDG
jgi:aryl-alcohol dehydrogenase-like predicted oxidoreductase